MPDQKRREQNQKKHDFHESLQEVLESLHQVSFLFNQKLQL